MRLDGICLYLRSVDRAQLLATIADRNTARAVVWRARIILATADDGGNQRGHARATTSKPTVKPTVWRWQARWLDEAMDGLRRDKTRPSRLPPLPRETRLEGIARTVGRRLRTPPHRSRALMAEAGGISPSRVERIWAERIWAEADLGRGGSQAASDARVQGVRRSDVRGESHRDRGALPRSAGSGLPDRAVRIGPSGFAVMKSRKSRPSTGPNPGCRSRRAAPPR